jgi:F0F1-type ATP synthase assembly protein I
MAINTQKFLPPPKIGAILKFSTANITKINKTNKTNNNSAEDPENNNFGIILSQIKIIQVKVTEINKIFKGTVAAQKKELDDKKREESKKRLSSKEKKLKTKSDNEKKDKLKTPEIPKMDFLDRIKDFIGKIILGFFITKLIDHLPKIVPIIKFIGGATDFIVNIGGNLLNGLITFIDWGYRAYDATRGFLKNIGGDNFTKVFDAFNGTMGTLIETAIIATIAIGSQGEGGLLDTGMDMLTDKLSGKSAKAVKGVTTTTKGAGAGAAAKGAGIGAGAVAAIVAGAGLLASALGEGAFQVRKFAVKPIEKLEKDQKNDRNPLTKIGRGVVLTMIRPLFGLFQGVGFLLDIIGAPFRYAIELIRYPFLSEEDKVKQANNLAKLDARIREDFRKGLNMLTLGLAFKEKGSFGNIYGNKGAQKEMMGKMQGGGTPITRGGKTLGNIKRTLKKGKYKRRIEKKPGEIDIKAGANIGGEEKLFGLFPKPEVPGFMNPFGVIKKSGKELGKSDYFGPILAITSKILLGQKPSLEDYKNVGIGINSLVSKGINSGNIKGGLIAAFAEGGFVDPETLSAISDGGGDITDWVAKSFKESTETNAQKTLREIRQNLKLQKTAPDSQDAGIDQKTVSDPNLDIGPGGDGSVVTGGNADFWTLVAVASLESGNPQGQADVAQAIYNRVASRSNFGQGSNHTVKGHILAKGQFQPVRETRGGYNTWSKIADKSTAISTLSAHPRGSNAERMIESTATNLRNSQLQQNAAEWVGGRTDFATPSAANKYPGGIGFKTRHGHLFGWYVGPGSIAYGKTNPGPAKAPTLGSIVVMGGGIPGDSGSMVSVKGGRAFPLVKGVIGTAPGQVYGAPRSYGGHAGVDVVEKQPWGKDPRIPVVSYASGKVLSEKYVPNHNYLAGLMVDHGSFQARYLHAKPSVRPGQTVQAGQRIGNLLNLGNQSHLHFEAYKGSARMNPTGLLRAAYSEGGETLDEPHIALLGEEGKEFVIKNRVLKSEPEIEKMLLAINQSNDKSGVIEAIQDYAPYDAMATQTVIVSPEDYNDEYISESNKKNGGIIPVPIGAEFSNPFETLYQGS